MNINTHIPSTHPTKMCIMVLYSMQRLRAQNKIHRVKCSVCEIIKHYFLPTKTFTLNASVR